jgi:hypothetical protein
VADDGGVLYLVVSGAPAPESIPALVAACQAAGWRVVVFSTLAGTRFIDPSELERLTGEPVRSEYRMPGTGASVPAADVVLACPLTFNNVNKFAHGHADNFVVGLLCEMAGYGVPVVVVPHCKAQLASHPAFAASLDTLRGMGVRIGRSESWLPQVEPAARVRTRDCSGKPDVAGRPDCDFRSTLAGCRAAGPSRRRTCRRVECAGRRASRLPVPVSRWCRRAGRGVLEGMLATALRCCGSRGLQISDSGV